MVMWATQRGFIDGERSTLYFSDPLAVRRTEWEYVGEEEGSGGTTQKRRRFESFATKGMGTRAVILPWISFSGSRPGKGGGYFWDLRWDFWGCDGHCGDFSRRESPRSNLFV